MRFLDFCAPLSAADVALSAGRVAAGLLNSARNSAIKISTKPFFDRSKVKPYRFYLKHTNVGPEMGHRRGPLTTLSGLGVLLSLCLIAYYYWDNPKLLLRCGYSLFLVFALLVVVRHVWLSVTGPLKASFGEKKEENGMSYDYGVYPEVRTYFIAH